MQAQALIAVLGGVLLFLMMSIAITSYRAGYAAAQRRARKMHYSSTYGRNLTDHEKHLIEKYPPDEPRRLLTQDTITIPLAPITQKLRRIS